MARLAQFAANNVLEAADTRPDLCGRRETEPQVKTGYQIGPNNRNQRNISAIGWSIRTVHENRFAGWQSADRNRKPNWAYTVNGTEIVGRID